jgi:mannan polymerase II complex MNN10 subunit
MKFVFTTLHNSTFEPLAKTTLDGNKLPYCIKHGYPLLVKNDDWHDIHIGHEKGYLIQLAFESYPECDWVFFSECDTLITNMDTKLEDVIRNEKKHFVITVDINGINAGSFFVKNSPEGRGFVQDMIDNIGNFKNEQDFIVDSYFISKKHTNIMSLYPQKTFNSYDYKSYGRLYPTGLDCLGNNGSWEPGDFIIHFAGKTQSDRLRLVDEYSQNKKNSVNVNVDLNTNKNLQIKIKCYIPYNK